MKYLLIIAAIVLILFGYMVIQNYTTPDLGVHDGQLMPMPKSPNAVSSQTSETDKYVAPFEIYESLEISKSIILEILNSYESVEIMKVTEDYIYAVFKTKWLRFRDDVEFYFDIKDQMIHFRSSSRVGYSDMGENLKRYNQLKAMYDEKSSN